MARSEDQLSLWLAIGLFLGIALVMAGDLVTDWREGVDVGHLALEGASAVLACAGAGVLGVRLHRAKQEAARLEELAQVLQGEASELRGELEQSRADAERWKQENQDVLKGLGAAIDRQFERWSLTPAEREVGLLLLKGLSHKEIAGVRDVSERTVRSQARALYKKAGLTGRADLAAYFLEDLLLPVPNDAQPGDQASKPS